jgi:hypothetical protein
MERARSIFREKSGLIPAEMRTEIARVLQG